MHPFSTPWKHQKTLVYVFRGYRKAALGTNGLNNIIQSRKRNSKLLIKSLNNVQDNYSLRLAVVLI